MIFKVFIGLVVLACLIYYFFCFLEVFGLIKFTGPKTEITFPKALIPFYYIAKKEPKEEEVKEEERHPIQFVQLKEDNFVDANEPIKKKNNKKKTTEV